MRSRFYSLVCFCQHGCLTSLRNTDVALFVVQQLFYSVVAHEKVPEQNVSTETFHIVPSGNRTWRLDFGQLVKSFFFLCHLPVGLVVSFNLILVL